MSPNLAQLINRTILVSVPAHFGDGACRSYVLLGVEPQGLWLQSEEATTRLLTPETKAYAAAAPAIFVPFAQIAAVLAPTHVPAALLTPEASDAPKQPAASNAPKQRAASGAPAKK